MSAAWHPQSGRRHFNMSQHGIRSFLKVTSTSWQRSIKSVVTRTLLPPHPTPPHSTPTPWQGKTRTMWRGAFFAKIYPTLRKTKKHTLLKDMLYTALSPDQPPQSDLLHPPQQMVLALDMSYLLAFSHLTPTDQTAIFPMKLLRAFAHFTLTFIPIFLVHLFHSVTVLLFSFSSASEPTSQVELSSLYVSNFLLAHHFLQF